MCAHAFLTTVLRCARAPALLKCLQEEEEEEEEEEEKKLIQNRTRGT